MKKLEYIRFGGLSPVNHKKFYKSDSFHSPPRKKGIYAFIYPYIEDFLWAWKIKDKETHKYYHTKNRRKFTYNGEIWVHWINITKKTGLGLEYNKDWVKIHTDDINHLFNMVKQSDRIYMNKDQSTAIIDPYKYGGNNIPISRDHLEVFIEKV